MVDQAKEASVETATPKTGRRKNVVLFGVLIGVMIAEALVVFVLVKSFGGASPASAPAPSTGPAAPRDIPQRLPRLPRPCRYTPPSRRRPHERRAHGDR